MRIEKSAEAKRKEDQIANLEKKIKRTQTTVKSLKTRLANMQGRIVEVQQGAFGKTERLRERLRALSEDMERLAGKLRKDRRLSKADRLFIDELYQGLAGGLGGQIPEMDIPDPAQREEEQARFRDAFKAFRVEPPRAEQKDIRQVYIRLSKKFHPDRADGKKEEKQFHQMQQQIIAAYQTHDIQTLLDLEALWGTAEEETPAASADALDAKLATLEGRLDMLVGQQERLSQEIRQLRQSEMGQMLTDVDGLAREGLSLEDVLPIQVLEEMIGLLEKVRGALADTDREGALSTSLREITEELAATPPVVEQMLGEMMEFYEEEEDPDWYGELMINPDPQFPVGSYVRIKEPIGFTYFDEQGAERFLDIQGYAGLVTHALIDEDGYPVYHIELDPASMERLPGAYVRGEGREFHRLSYLEENALVREKRERRVSARKIQRVYRQLRYRHLLEDLAADQRNRLRAILLADPAGSDEKNWLAHFEENLPLPFNALTRGLIGDFPAGRKAKVLAYRGFSDDHGALVLAKVGHREFVAPLAEFTGPGPGPITTILDDYREWLDLVCW